MTLKEAENVCLTLKLIQSTKSNDGALQKLYREGKHEEVARIALELNSELRRVYEAKLAGYPSLNEG